MLELAESALKVQIDSQLAITTSNDLRINNEGFVIAHKHAENSLLLEFILGSFKQLALGCNYQGETGIKKRRSTIQQ